MKPLEGETHSFVFQSKEVVKQKKNGSLHFLVLDLHQHLRKSSGMESVHFWLADVKISQSALKSVSVRMCCVNH